MSNDVFFLGSGFSKAVNSNYPLLSELTEILLGKELANFGHPDKNRLPKSCTSNFEDLMTYLASDMPWKTEIDKAYDKASYLEITQNIVNHFNRLRFHNIHENEFKPFWEYIYKKCTPIITLNYDLIAEKNLNLTSHQIPSERPGAVLFDPDSCEEFYRGNVIDIKNKIRDITNLSDKMPEIIKLHGSINWFYKNYDDNSQIYCANPNDDENKLLGGYNPLIVPPVLDKTVFYNNLTIKHIWKSAFEKLSNADNIYIYGFSFPPTDLSVRFLFQSALSNNCKNPKIFVINTSDALKKESEYYLEDRFKEIFEGYNLNFDYCCDNSLEKFVQEVIEPKLEVANAN